MKSGDDYSVIYWTPTSERPEEGSYVLLKYVSEGEEPVCLDAAYEHGRFFVWAVGTEPLSEDGILGWSYYPFDGRERR